MAILASLIVVQLNTDERTDEQTDKQTNAQIQKCARTHSHPSRQMQIIVVAGFISEPGPVFGRIEFGHLTSERESEREWSKV